MANPIVVPADRQIVDMDSQIARQWLHLLDQLAKQVNDLQVRVKQLESK